MDRRRLSVALTLLLAICAATAARAATVQTFSPQGEIARVRQVRATFSEPMVRFGDPRLPAPFDLRCNPGATGSGRWVDDKTWVFDFNQDVAAGTQCSVALKGSQKALSGEAVTGTTTYAFSTGGPSVVRPYPYPDGDVGNAEEEQVFALLLNGAATADSVQKFGRCEVDGVREQIPLQVVGGDVRRPSSRP